MVVLQALEILGSAMVRLIDGADIHIAGFAVPMLVLMCLAAMGMLMVTGNGRRI